MEEFKLSNNGKKYDNDNIRTIQSKLNELNRIVREKDKVVDVTPEASLIEKYQDQNLPDVVEDDAFSTLCERVAALQFAGNKKEDICSALEIDTKTYKDIVLSDSFIAVKKRIAEDNKVYILSRILNQVDSAIMTLADLQQVADEDKVRLNAAALVLEHASRLLEEQKAYMPNIENVIKDAAKGTEPVTVTLAQIILKNREDRGLSK
jgi:hypothetical protein